MTQRLIFAAALLALAACSDAAAPDKADAAAADTATVTDAVSDAGPDTAPADTAPADTTPADTAPADTAPADTAAADTTPADTTTVTDAFTDAGPDVAPADTASASDAGTVTDTATVTDAFSDAGPDVAPADAAPAADTATVTDAVSDAVSDAFSDAGPEPDAVAGLDAAPDVPPLSDDPYDPASCQGVAWDQDAALARLAGASREVLAGATIQRRARACPGGACEPWGPAADWEITYLTYSGGVTTRYMQLLASMNLVLYAAAGVPRLSVQHTTFAAGGYPDSDGMVYDLPPAPISYPHVRAFNVSPQYSSDYEDLDYQVKAGTLTLGEGCARWVADPFGAGEPYTVQYALLFRWP